MRLEKILKKLADNQINIEYMYSYTKDGKTNILIKTDDLETTENALK